MRFSTFVYNFFAATALAQQYAGDTISANLPTIAGTEVAFFKIPDTTGANNNLTLINYYSHGSDGNRIVEANIQRAIIVLHGLLRDPWNYENDVSWLLSISRNLVGLCGDEMKNKFMIGRVGIADARMSTLREGLSTKLSLGS